MTHTPGTGIITHREKTIDKMSQTTEEIIAAALKLPPESKARLADELLASLDEMCGRKSMFNYFGGTVSLLPENGSS